MLDALTEENRNKYLDKTQSAFIAALIRMKELLPFEEHAIFDSEVVFLKRNDSEKWNRLKERFYNIIKPEECNDFQEELGCFRYNFLEIKSETLNNHIMQVWRSNQTKYPLLYKLTRALMVSPYSSCSIERVFSQCTDIKTIKRNRLSIDNLSACLLVKQKFGDNKLEFSENMLLRYNKECRTIFKIIPTNIENDPKVEESKKDQAPRMEIEKIKNNDINPFQEESLTPLSAITRSFLEAAKSFEKAFSVSLKGPIDSQILKQDKSLSKTKAQSDLVHEDLKKPKISERLPDNGIIKSQESNDVIEVSGNIDQS